MEFAHIFLIEYNSNRLYNYVMWYGMKSYLANNSEFFSISWNLMWLFIIKTMLTLHSFLHRHWHQSRKPTNTLLMWLFLDLSPFISRVTCSTESHHFRNCCKLQAGNGRVIQSHILQLLWPAGFFITLRKLPITYLFQVIVNSLIVRLWYRIFNLIRVTLLVTASHWWWHWNFTEF